jgi:UDP-N-acetylglucosamine acyltransferase
MSNNQIHPSAVIGPDVELGSDNVVGPYAVLDGPLVVGDGNWFGPHTVVGTPTQWTGVTGREIAEQVGNGVRIGHGNVLREFVTVHQGTDRITTIEDETYLMAYAHVPHDAYIAHQATLTNATQLAGHTSVGWRANLGLGTVVHQRTVIGPYAMVGMQSVVTGHLPPGALAFGSPAKLRGVNRVGLQRAGFEDDEIDEIERALAEERSAPVERLVEAQAWFDARVAMS